MKGLKAGKTKVTITLASGKETGHFHYCAENNGKNNKDHRTEIKSDRCKE